MKYFYIDKSFWCDAVLNVSVIIRLHAVSHLWTFFCPYYTKQSEKSESDVIHISLYNSHCFHESGMTGCGYILE